MRHDDILGEFLTECEEKLDRLNLLLTKLEKEGFDREILRQIARDVHTVKGSSQLFGFGQIGQVTHAMEECLVKLSGAADEVLPELLECLYRSLDVVSKLFKIVKVTKNEPPPNEDVSGIILNLEGLAKRAASHKGENPHEARPPHAASAVSAPAHQDSGPKPPEDHPVGSKKTPASAAAKPAAAAGEDAHVDTIRVHVDLLDNLMNLIGELVLIRNQLTEVAKESESENLARVSQRLSVITGELQNDVMKTRMQPIGNVLNKFQRVVRDMAKDLGKRVELALSGTETELDKTLIEAIRDPLTHIVRNAVDHGIEGIEERQRQGKKEHGTLAIRAFHESGQVVIEIKDDGKGLNRDKIAAKAIEKGLVTQEAAANLADRDVFQFIFLPGFSTAEKVSNLSGRGVGMDVVRTNIEKIGGTVELASTFGQGTTLTLRIPLTLAIIPALLVHAGQEKFAIPQVKLLELLRVETSFEKGKGIEYLQGRPVFRLRGTLLPLVRLAEVLKLDHPAPSSQTTLEQSELNIAVFNVDRNTFGLVIDTIDDSADIVVKPLASFLKDIGAYSGATILGDGSIALTLDISGVAHLANIKSEVKENANARAGAETEVARIRSYGDENTEYLLVELGVKGKYALPLCLVNRLEEFEGEEIRFSGEKRVVKYRDSLLPLICVKEALGFTEKGKVQMREKVAVVVVKKGDRYFGLEVNSVVDVILSPAKIDMDIKDRGGILGSLIDGDDVIAMIDALGIIDAEMASLSRGSHVRQEKPEAARSAAVRAKRAKFKILLAEDGAFFRKHISQVLEEAGYSVQVECDGSLAFAALKRAPPNAFAALVSDIEMPQMTGFDLVQKVRAAGELAKLPMIALSSRFSDEDVKKGLSLGFNRYIEKLNPEQLIVEVDSMLGIAGGIKNVG